MKKIMTINEIEAKVNFDLYDHMERDIDREQEIEIEEHDGIVIFLSLPLREKIASEPISYCEKLFK